MKIKRLLAVLLAVMLTVTALGGALTASAAASTDPYVLRYDGEGAKPYLYGSRYEYKHSYNDPEAGESSVWTYWNCPEIFNLINTRDGSSIAAYCTDADTSTRSDTGYRRMNLEDSRYHVDGAAARLRSVILNTFPRLSVEEVAAAANAAGYTVTDLAQGELISATQQAIWEITHGDKYTVDDHSTGLRSMSSYDEADFVYPESLEAVETDYTAANMENLYNYFLSLEGTAPLTDAVSEYTFENVTYSAAEEADGTYTITAAFTVNTTVDAGDQLTLTATCGDQVTTQALTAGEQSVTFTGIPAATGVKLEITGLEQGGDVYLFDAAGDRTASQSMVGWEDSLLPVYAVVTAAPDRTLTIEKTTGDQAQTPLENIEFSIYYVCSLEDYLNGKVALGAIPTEDDLTAYATAENLIATVKTGSDGKATCSFGQVDAVYLVKELENPLTEQPVAPFFVYVPTTDPDSGLPVYSVTLHPKNDVIPESVDIEKDVTRIDNDHDTYDVNEVHTWIIQATIPAGMATGLKYEISDTLDCRLTYQGNLAVSVAKPTDPTKTETVWLTADTDYTVTVGTAQDGDGHTVDTFVVALTSAGMKKVADTADADKENTYEVRVYFDAVINPSTQLGQEIPNRAHIDYINNIGKAYESDSDIPEVHTGGLQIAKVDAATGDKLAGASFKLARAAAQGEAAQFTALIDGVETGMVYVDFYSTADMTGEKVSEVTTGQDGTALLYGLAYGKYYLFETAAPSGYNKLTQPVAVEVSATSHILDDPSTGAIEGSAVTVTNSAKFVLPETGGVGTTVFTVTGLTIICAAVVLYIIAISKRRAS